MQAIILAFILSIGFTPIKSNSNSQVLPVVDYVDIQSYMGKWYEIARYDNSFQRKCGASYAYYQLSRSNKVEVTNVCQNVHDPSKVHRATGLARVIDSDTNAILKVSFVPIARRFGWFGGDYWIIALDDNYQYAMVGTPDRKFLWILSRDPYLDERILSDLKLEAKNLGFKREILHTPKWKDL